MSSSPLLPSHNTFTSGPFQGLICRELTKAIENQEHVQVVNYADDMLQSHLLKVLDARAYGNCMQGKCSLAIEDAQRMIDFSPTVADGYLRKGDILSMYGRQRCAIATYDTGMERIKMDEDNEQQIEQLVLSTTEAIILDAKRIDFIARLPIDIVDLILLLLPKDTKAACLAVSTAWRRKVLECKTAWKRVVLDDSPEDLDVFVGAIQFIAPSIEHLTINTEVEATRLKYLRCIATQNMRPYTLLFAHAFWQTCHTLTKLNIDLGDSHSFITLAEVLSSCVTITDLTYSTTSSMSAVTGDFSVLESNRMLTNLELKATAITGREMESVLQHCFRIHRLVINGCDPSVFDPIDRLAPYLEILAYNHPNPVPELYHHKEQQGKVNDSNNGSSSNSSRGGEQKTGLRMIYTNNGGRCVPTSALFPLLYKNQKTLETVFVMLSDLTRAEVCQFKTHYADFKMDKLTSFTFWPLRAIQPFLLRSINRAAALTCLRIAEVSDLRAIIKVLLDMPPLETFAISHMPRMSSNATTAACGTSLIQLFERYACVSMSQPSLRCITFRHCHVVTDAVLAALAHIKTLESITLSNLERVTAAGLQEFVRSMSEQVKSITLTDMESATNDVIAELGSCACLEEVSLDSLSKLTDDGLNFFIESPIPALTKLTLRKCPLVTEECLVAVKENVKVVIQDD
ncbi:hypothetical protein BDB00DRAFT_866982 [Zychaea mexicana]|uniref:uncharacterized protein n=1 Tax=Zychaea mexicana TaxID=64656 RepID=UPI0022FE60F2|nr:uncharacterized protein BDB00DRAFT_866982 [Zychaea mexicana]KAI9498913.1 hypothetical protein BDB00DRAFT_866982 [Zychaea mexicana]